MSKADVTQIQKEIKQAIQNHQQLVTSLKNDSQNGNLKKQLQDVQSTIQKLNEKQKSIVKELRKNVANAIPITPKAPDPVNNTPKQVTKQVPVATSSSTHTSSQPIISKPQKPTPPPTKKHPRKETQVPRPSSPLRVPTYQIKRPSILRGKPRSRPQENTRQTEKPSQNTTKPSQNTEKKPSQNNNVTAAKVVNSQPLSVDVKSHNQSLCTQGMSLKYEFMAALELINQESIKDLKQKRTERKRRTKTTNPQFSVESGLVPHYRRSYGGSPLSKKPRGRYNYRSHSPSNSRPGSPAGETAAAPCIVLPVQIDNNHDNYCCVCSKSGELLMCDSCSLVYHLQCTDPPLTSIPKGLWSCPKCQAEGVKISTAQYSEQLSAVHSYIAKKAAKEDEKKRLLRRTVEINLERQQLERRSQRIDEALERQDQEQKELLAISTHTQKSVDDLKKFICVFQS